MVKNEFYYLSADNKTQIHAVEWKPEKEIIGVIQIAHGVTEHILRYEQFAEFFTQKGLYKSIIAVAPIGAIRLKTLKCEAVSQKPHQNNRL